MKILVTGTAGFIGFHLANRLLKNGHEVIGLDNINDYYDVNLKYARLEQSGIDRKKIEWNNFVSSEKYPKYRFIKMNLEDRKQMESLFSSEKFDVVCNLAAQAGVRYSIKNPHTYVQSNIVGFLNILEGCRHNNVKHFVYASSSSVYGLNEKMPLSTSDNVDHPISLYAATKKSNELMAHTYSHLYGLPTTGLRFFTVYGPWGRPDMAIYLFTKAIVNNEPIKVFNYGNMFRDFTFIDDIIDGVERIINKPSEGNTNWDSINPMPDSSKSPFKIYNIGNSNPVKLLDFIDLIEKKLGLKAKKEMIEIQPGDVEKTFADIKSLSKDFGYTPNTSIEYGIGKFVDWYQSYIKV